MLFSNRSLNIAILISASWHLACIFFVTPVILTGNIKKNSTTISFLGSILESIVAAPDKVLGLDQSYFVRTIKDSDIAKTRKKILDSPESISKFFPGISDKEESAFFEAKETGSLHTLHYEKKEMQRIEVADILLGGEARKRNILFKPLLPKTSVLIPEFGAEHEVVLGFRISEEGLVKSPECLISSGFPEVDHEAIRYIRRWQFAPQENADGLTEGIVRLNFR